MTRAIFAVDNSGGMSSSGYLPWPKDLEDMQRFKQYTQNHVVVMGRKTWESSCMPHPLPNRINVVVSRFEFMGTDIDHVPDITICPSSFQESIELVTDQYPDKHIWIIGGAQLLLLAKPIISEIFLTVFNDKYTCDVELDVTKYLTNFTLHNCEICQTKRFEHWVKTAR